MAHRQHHHPLLEIFKHGYETRTKEKQISQRLVLEHGQKRVRVKRQRSYNLMLDSACKHFRNISRDVVIFQTSQLDVCDGYYVDITAEIWFDVIDLLNVVEVARRAEMTLPVPLPLDASAISLPDNQSALSQVNEQDSFRNDDKVTIILVFPSGEIQTAKIPRKMKVDELIADASQKLGHHPIGVRAVLSRVSEQRLDRVTMLGT
ncbi:uncharacterized protein F5891DRAFT_734363 [Suillus fuscotomentosus]|uniref:Uncharacterized protein n=1 Tax=Suillus fuscotomentosus TaxID=1912939 RepID=A0AAD4DUM1_9AGAM|nr:uncharacterized protein F5891DRAFT_734363 [Suillus fuscotomentosus]KAG1894167.1 hypothetical protein F5891DRAFT_734363 [Suillus fuscotomentosus]